MTRPLRTKVSPSNRFPRLGESPKERPIEAFSTPLATTGTVFDALQVPNKETKDAIYSLANEILHDRSQMEALAQRVYELLMEEVQYRRERSQVYGGRL